MTQWTPASRSRPAASACVRSGAVGEVDELGDRERVELDPVAVALADGREEIAVEVERELRVEAAVEGDEVAADREQVVDLREHLLA